MNSKEREVMSVIYDVVNRFTGLRPTNPCNTAQIFKNSKIVDTASGHLLYALSSLNIGDTVSALEFAELALKAVEK